MSHSTQKGEGALTLGEEAVEAELAYYRQVELCQPTVGDQTNWQRIRAQYEAAYPTREFPGTHDPSLYMRYILERHGYSLHYYMAYHLRREAWQWWFEQVDFHSPLLTLYPEASYSTHENPR